MRKHLVFLFIFTASFVIGQESIINPVERAYLFHIVKKSPILDHNIGRYFEYTGPEVKFLNGNIHYDSIETHIINNPEYLVIRDREIAKSSKGILAETANKLAIWELNKMLLAKRTNDPNFDVYLSKYNEFERILQTKLPLVAFEDNGTKLHPRLQNLLNPSLSLEDRLGQMNVFKGTDVNDHHAILTGIADAINTYVEMRTAQVFKTLGGEYNSFHNWLVAVGDGSSTSGILDEREKDEKGRWNKGLPKAVGLFPYELFVKQAEKKKQEPKIKPRWTVTKDFFTAGENRNTQIHLDVWGYNSSKQTTVVIEKAGKNYPLFGSVDTRFLSPDSSFSSGGTFMGIIKELQVKYIDDLTEKIEGKRGFDYWIEHYKLKMDETDAKINKASKTYSDRSYQPITTSSKVPNSVKKSKKNAMKAGSGADSWHAEPKTDADKAGKAKGQSEIMYLYERFEWYKAKIKELEKEKKEAVDLRASYEQTRDEYKRLIGHSWMPFTEKDGLYTFSDSSTFDIHTQDFTFPASEKAESFEVRLIGIPASATMKNVDEVMMHLSMVDAKPKYDARIQLALQDVFESNKYDLENPLFQNADSVSVLQFFEALLEKNVEFKIVARGQGAGEWNGSRVVSTMKEEMSNYGALGKDDEVYRQLRLSEVFITLNRGIVLEVNSFTDPVRTNFDSSSPAIISAKKQFNLTGNQILSAYRTATILKKLKQELNVLAGEYLTREQAKVVIDKLNKAIDKQKVAIGPISIKLSDF